MKNKIQILELLRFVSMTEVFLIHFMNDYIHSEEGWHYLMVSGQLGVAFFFMISAYLLVITTKVDENGFKVASFYKRKVFSLLPKYEFILFAIFIAAKVMPSLFRTFDVSNINFIKSMFLIPYVTEGVPFVCPMLPVAWTLIVQSMLFITWGICIKITKSTDKTVYVMTGLLLLAFLLGQFLNCDNVITYAYCRFYNLYFVAGFLTAQIEKTSELRKISSKIGGGYLSTPICIVGLIIFLIISCFYEETLAWFLMLFAIFAVLIITLKKFTLPNWCIFMGRISYSFFLLHYLICKVFTRVFPMYRDYRLGIMLIGCFIITVLLSWSYDSVVNKIMKNIIRK